MSNPVFVGAGVAIVTPFFENGDVITYRLVERNQGTIAIESVLGQGSVFTVTFPVFDTEEDSL